jgi:ABC-type bacteriocin/lantibiotic exporter with double-glycine peptidase domain
MVLRYWGDPVAEKDLGDARPRASESGVEGSRLAAAARSRGFRAFAYAGDIGHLRQQVVKGRPLVVALRSGRSGFHDVVVVGFEDDHTLVVNDPERGPLRRVSRRAFEKGWASAGYWTLLVVPESP